MGYIRPPRDLGVFPSYTGSYIGKDFPRVEGVQGGYTNPRPNPSPNILKN